MDTTLVVVRSFGTHAIGDRITAPEAIAATLASDHAYAVVAVLTPSPPANSPSLNTMTNPEH